YETSRRQQQSATTAINKTDLGSRKDMQRAMPEIWSKARAEYGNYAWTPADFKQFTQELSHAFGSDIAAVNALLARHWSDRRLVESADGKIKLEIDRPRLRMDWSGGDSQAANAMAKASMPHPSVPTPFEVGDVPFLPVANRWQMLFK